jgi:hypothetical protein
LRHLEDNGVIERHMGARPNVTEYVLTEAGNDLAEVIKHFGTWAIKWVFNDPNRDELDPALFVWKMHQRVNDREFPRRRTVVQFDLTGRRARKVWLTLVRGDVSSSLKPPGFEPDLVVRADVAVLYRVWAGFVDYDAAVRRAEILLEGPPALVEAFPSLVHVESPDGCRKAVSRPAQNQRVTPMPKQTTVEQSDLRTC